MLNRSLVPVALLASLAIALVAYELVLHRHSPDANDPRKDAIVISSKKVGDALVVHLINFRKNTGHFPRTLGELVPSELGAIPLPQVPGGKWIYTQRGDHFSLEFFDRRTGETYTTSDIAVWSGGEQDL